MSKKKTRLQIAQEKAELAVRKTNGKIDELGKNTCVLYEKLSMMQLLFDQIRNVPAEEGKRYDEIKKTQLEWKQQVENIEEEYKRCAAKHAGKGTVGVLTGVAIAAVGPTAAMGVATTFGVASTGTAIGALSGAAATNAALAWLGGGALAAGGGGMAAGEFILAMAGPVGLVIAGLALLGSGLALLKSKGDRERLENVFTLISERDVRSYELAIVELNERIKRIEHEGKLLNDAIGRIFSYGTDYNKMTEAQQYELGSYINLMEASTMLLVNPILGLLPKHTETDYEKFCLGMSDTDYYERYKAVVVSLANLLYDVKIDNQDKKLIAKSFKKNEEFLNAMEIKKKEMTPELLEVVEACLSYR